MKRKQNQNFLLASLLLLTLIVISCKKNNNESSDYIHFKKIMTDDQNIMEMNTNLMNTSNLILSEAYLKRAEFYNYKITNSLTPFLVGKKSQLAESAKMVKNEQDFKNYLTKIGLKAQSDNYAKLIKNFLEAVQVFYEKNPAFKKLPKEQQIQLIYSSMKSVRTKEIRLFKPVQDNAEPDPCWNDWSEAIQDAQDDQFWEMTGLAVGFVLCAAATEVIGAVFCYDAYVAGSALSALHYADNVGKADDRYNKCVGDQTQI